MFPKGRIPDDNPVYYFASCVSLCYVGSGPGSSDGPASDGNASPADFNPGRSCTNGCSGTSQHDSNPDHDRTSDADHDEGSWTRRAEYAASTDPGDEPANRADYGQSCTTRDTGNAGEWDDVRARATRHERIECKRWFVDR